MNTSLPLKKRRSLPGTMKPGSLLVKIFCIFIVSHFIIIGNCHAAGGSVIAWGDNQDSQINVPSPLTNIVAVAGGSFHSLALKNTGAVVGWGDNSYGETSSSNVSNAVAIAAGDGFSLALESNGLVSTWGNQINMPAGLTNITAISASMSNELALTDDGNLISWGVVSPPPANATNIVAIAAGNTHSLALTGEGTVIAWGDSALGATTVPSGLTNVVALAAGEYHSLVLRDNGTVVAWGDNTWGQTNVPAGLSNVVAIAAGAFHNVALKQDGTVLAWGDNTYYQTNMPSGLSNVVGIAAGRYHSLAIVGDGSPVITIQPISQYNPDTQTAFFRVMAAGLVPISYQWQQDGADIVGATNSVLELTNLSTADAGVYSVTVSNLLGTVESTNAELPPVWRRPFFLIQPQDNSVICDDGTNFQASADGTKPLSYQWQFEGAAISDATNPVLVLNHLTEDQAGEYSVVVSNINGSTTSRAAILTVIAEPPLITSALTVSGKQGKNFSYTITGLHNPASFSAGGLPAGLDVNATNGVIQGAPLQSGIFKVTLGTANLCASAQTNLVLTIASSAPVINSHLTASGREQTAFNYKITATQTPTNFDAENLPQGLNVDPATGIISGNPLYAGIYDVTISASNTWGIGSTDLVVTISNALISGLSIVNVTTNYSAPYLLDFQFSLQDDQGNSVVTDPQLLTVTALENNQPVGSETAVTIQSGSSKVLKAYLVLDFTASIASLANGDTNNNGISDAVDTEVNAAQTFVNQQPADAQIGVYEFHRDDESPQQVQSLTIDKTLLDNSIAGIWTNYVQNFPAGSRCWDALVAAIGSLGAPNNDEQHYVVFVSDGQDDSSTNTIDDVIAAATNSNVQIYCVGFGDELNTATLQQITSQTSGRYYSATNTSDLAAELGQIGKDLNGQYILRWATLKRSATAFMPSFQITYQGITANSPTNPQPRVSGTNYVVITTNTPPTTNEVLVYTTNYIISPYTPTLYAGDVTVGSLRLVSDAAVHPTGIDLRATYVPRYIRQIRLHYQANWPCTVSLQSTNVGEMLYGWSLTQTNDGAGGQWVLISSPDPQNIDMSIPFASFGELLAFTFRDVLDASNAFSFFDVDNTLYTNTGNQSFTNENFGGFVTVYSTSNLPFGTPVPWLMEYGFTNDFAAAETNDSDGDGMLNWQEYQAGTNPTNASSVFAVQNLSPTGPFGEYQITFGTVLNRTYRVEVSNDLQNWQTLQDDIIGTGGDVTVTDTRNLDGVVGSYYRLVVY